VAGGTWDSNGGDSSGGGSGDSGGGFSATKLTIDASPILICYQVCFMSGFIILGIDPHCCASLRTILILL